MGQRKHLIDDASEGTPSQTSGAPGAHATQGANSQILRASHHFGRHQNWRQLGGTRGGGLTWREQSYKKLQGEA